MTPNAFIGKTAPPTEEELAAALGAAKLVWDQLLAELDRECDVMGQEWNCYSPKAGWSLRVKRKTRTIVWLGPRAGSFVAAFVLGDKAMEAARAAKLPQRVVKLMEEAPKYAEGTGIRLAIKAPKDIPAVKAIAAIKIAN
jgi:hypothetical protein